MLAEAVIRAVARARYDELARVALKARVTVAHAVAAHPMRVALLWTALEDGAIIAIKAGIAEAATAPALSLAAAAVRAGHLPLARVARKARVAHALAAHALAIIGAAQTLRVDRACGGRRAVLALPSSVAEASTIGADTLLVRSAVVRARDRERAILAIVPRITEAAAILASAAARTVLRPLTARWHRAVGPVVTRAAVASTILAQAVATAVARALSRLAAVDARPLGVTRAHAVDAQPTVVALVRTCRQLDAAVHAAVTLLTETVAVEADAVPRAIAWAEERLRAVLALPIRMAHALAHTARAMARAAIGALEERL